MHQRNGVEQHFCMKTRYQAYSRKPRRWPSGEYCIFQNGRICPEGFSSGYIIWRDLYNISRSDWRDSKNSFSDSSFDGYIPTGNYTRQVTQIYFCCRYRDFHKYLYSSMYFSTFWGEIDKLFENLS